MFSDYGIILSTEGWAVISAKSVNCYLSFNESIKYVHSNVLTTIHEIKPK